VGAHDGAVEHQPLDVAIGRQPVHQHLPDALLLPQFRREGGEAFVDAVPRAEFVGQQPPRRPGTRHPEHRLEKPAHWRLMADIDAGMLFQAGPEPLPLVVREPRTNHRVELPADFRSAGSRRDLIQNVNRA
jgi:hypothetical protein